MICEAANDFWKEKTKGFGETVKRMRLAKGWRLRDLADVMDTSLQLVWSYENNLVKNIPFQIVERFAEAFGTTSWAMLGIDTNQNAMTSLDEVCMSYLQAPEDVQTAVRKLLNVGK